MQAFSSWLAKKGAEAEFLARASEDISYGRELFDAGRFYWHYAETINGVASGRPAIRRQLRCAWDVAFSWMALEPYTLHVAMPAVLLLAILAVCITWGWKAEAGISRLAWGALLRIGEVTTDP